MSRAASSIALALALALLAGCEGDGEATSESPATAVPSTTPGAIACYVRAESFEDCDDDGVFNSADVLPFRNDLGDDDGDLVLNRLDRHPGQDDHQYDFDRDGVPDFQDTFLGPNAGDADNDGLMNALDPQPYASPPSGTAIQPPPSMTDEQLTTELLLSQMAGKYAAEAVGPEPDSDLDGISDDVDTTPDDYTNDRDGDGEADFYDPEPADPYLDSRNDPYDPSNDEYWD